MFRKKEKVEITPGDPQFFVRYIGRTQTYIASGKGCTKIPVQRLWDNAIEEKKMKKVSLLVTPNGIVMTELENKEVEIKFDIKNISYCSAEQDNHDKLFAWIHRDKESKDMFCHVVLCPSKEKSQAMAVVLNKAFQIAYKDWKSSKGKVARKKVTEKIQMRSKESFDKTDRVHGVKVHRNDIRREASMSSNHSNGSSCHSSGHGSHDSSPSHHSNGHNIHGSSPGRQSNGVTGDAVPFSNCDNNLAGVNTKFSSPSQVEIQLGQMNIRTEEDDDMSFTENNAILDAEEEARIEMNEAVQQCLKGDSEVVIEAEQVSP